MSLVGKLEDVRLPELLQVLALGGKTGKLALTSRAAFGLIVMRRGKVIYAVCNGVRETFGHILVCRNLLDEATLVKALELQHRSREEQRLGAILVKMGALSADVVEAMILEQTAKVIAELFAWPGGFFRFDPAEIPDHGEVEVDARDFLAAEGVNAEQVAIDILLKLGDSETAERVRGAVKGAGKVVAPTAGLEPAATLGSIVDGVHTPAFVGEVTLSFLREAARVVNRGVLFAVRRDDYVGMGQFGLSDEGEPADIRVRRLRVPLAEPSVLATAFATAAMYRGRLAATPANRHLVEQLGGETPREVVALPIHVQGRVAAIFYGDNLPSDARVGPTRGLEILALEAGAAFDRAKHQRSPAPAPR